jgi:hypothetical protein
MTRTFPSLRAARPRPEPWNPAPTRRDSRAISMPTIHPNRRHRPPGKPTDRHERSRLGGGLVDPGPCGDLFQRDALSHVHMGCGRISLVASTLGW